MFIDKKKDIVEKPPSQMTQRSGLTIGGRPYQTHDIQRGPLGPPGQRDLLLPTL
jgi:hypothetical protein